MQWVTWSGLLLGRGYVSTKLRLTPYISHPRIDEVHHIYKASKEKGGPEAQMNKEQSDEIYIVNRVITPVPPEAYDPDNTGNGLVGIYNSYTTILSCK